MRIDLEAVGQRIVERFPAYRLMVDTVLHPPTHICFRARGPRPARIYVYGNSNPKIETHGIQFKDFDLLRAVLDELEKKE